MISLYKLMHNYPFLHFIYTDVLCALKKKTNKKNSLLSINK